jgi:hypothetical protein
VNQKNYDKIKKTHQSKLLKYFPDKVVAKIASKNFNLYQQMRSFAIKQDMTITDYVRSLGFIYMEKKIGREAKKPRLTVEEKTQIALEHRLAVQQRRELRRQETDNRFVERLTELFPDKVVDNLREINRSLLTMIMATAKKRGMTKEEYLGKLGFTYKTNRLSEKQVVDFMTENHQNNTSITLSDLPPKIKSNLYRVAKTNNTTTTDYLRNKGIVFGKRWTEDKLKSLLNKAYPDKVITCLYEHLGHSVYAVLLRFAQSKGITLKDLLVKEWGYKNYKNAKRIRRFTDEMVISILLENFPDRKILGFSRENTTLLLYVNNRAKKLGITRQQLLSQWGFEYNEKNFQKVKSRSVDEIVSMLTELYPDKFVFRLFEKNNSLYYSVLFRARKNKISMFDYLKSIGFYYERNVRLKYKKG